MSNKNDDTAATAPRNTTHRIINQLIQLQDLIYTRDQQSAATGSRLTSLDQSIEQMMNDLPADISGHFKRAIQKNSIGISPMTNGVCSACGMGLPVSQVPLVHASETLHKCRNCMRFLYHQEDAPRRLGKRRSRSEPPQVGIARFSSADLMVNLSATDRDTAMKELCEKLQSEGFVDNADRLLDEALRREAIMSTAIDHGIAFPHVRGVEGGGLTLALGVSKKGIKFNPASRQLTRLIFLIVIPTAASAFYLKLLSGLAQTFSDENAREQILKASSPEDIWKLLLKSTRLTVS
jgi:mannitol/fructose-specific phosphotransferase system IIA component (Ntr-type)